MQKYYMPNLSISPDPQCLVTIQNYLLMSERLAVQIYNLGINLLMYSYVNGGRGKRRRVFPSFVTSILYFLEILRKQKQGYCWLIWVGLVHWMKFMIFFFVCFLTKTLYHSLLKGRKIIQTGKAEKFMAEICKI